MSVLAIDEQGEIPTVDDAPEPQVKVRYLAVLEEGDTGWGAYLPDVPGVITTGATEDEVREQIEEAAAFHLEGITADGEPRPKAASRPYWVVV